MDIQFKINDDKQGKFYIEINEKQVAELEFEIKDNILNAYHTGVIKELEGKGIAGKLFDEMILYAHKNGYKVLPTCSYILVKFKRNEELYKDIWFKDEDEPTGESCGLRPKDKHS